ncbi:hypothetical protein [Paraburkholderia tropica]|uniref:hypothetical protein n=1 Tax=Paraburkholderia tropica TaxID=92647 RepID=UPI003D26618B
MHSKSQAKKPAHWRAHAQLAFGISLMAAMQPALPAASASPVKGGAFQCVTELVNTATPDKPHLKQLFYVAYSPDIPWMRISLVQNSESNEKSVHYTIRTVQNGVVNAVNGNGLLAAFDTRSATLRLGGVNPRIEGTCDRLQ